MIANESFTHHAASRSYIAHRKHGSVSMSPPPHSPRLAALLPLPHLLLARRRVALLLRAIKRSNTLLHAQKLLLLHIAQQMRRARPPAFQPRGPRGETLMSAPETDLAIDIRESAVLTGVQRSPSRHKPLREGRFPPSELIVA